MTEAGVDVPAAARAGLSGTACILVVDDDESIRTSLLAALQRFGFDAVLAETGRGALEIIESRRPDLVVLDVMLPDEVVVRVRGALRRERREMTVLRCEDLEMDDSAHLVVRNGVTVDLTPTEYTLLRHLLRNAGSVVSKHELFENVWGGDWLGRSNVIETYIGYLRRKIGPGLIQTVRGFGYVLRPSDGVEASGVHI